MKKVTLLMALILICSWQFVMAQKTITGKVTDAKTGSTMPGVNVVVKGTTDGTVTNLDGAYSLKLPANAQMLVFSFVGYVSQEVAIGNLSTLNVTLAISAEVIEGVVVTALGIKRDKKALGYSLQEIKGEGITETRDPNVVNALNGKIAGLQVRQASTGASGSSRMIIRGNNSIGADNQPLVVVDGIPINSSTGGTDDYWGNRNVDRGSGIADISPDDIESISVLKGPAASALYGSRAGNGVVMITTKKGSTKKGLGIAFNTNTTFESPMETPDFQDVYGQGVNGAFDVTAGGSWGGKMDGTQVDALMGKKAYSPAGNNLYKDFLQTGVTSTNSLELSTGSDNSTLRLGVTRLDNKGVVPNSKFNRTSIDIRSTGKWNKLSADVKFNYINQNMENRLKLASDPDNIFLNYLQMPRSVAMSDYTAYESTNYAFTKYGSPASFIANYGGMSRNPYWSAYRNTNNDSKDRIISFMSLKYDFTSWLNLRARYGLDYSGSMYSDRLATGTPYWFTEGISGDYRVIQDKSKEQNADFLLMAQGDLFGKLKGVASFGGNLMNFKSTYQFSQAQGLVIPDFYAVANGVNRETGYTTKEKETRSWYGTASLSYADWAYLDITGRNDESSTLPVAQRSYFYPSFGGSVIVSQLLTNKGIKMGPVSFAKVRASWAEVGNGTDPYMLNDYYNIQYVAGVLTASPDNYKTNPNLKPESIKSTELGLDVRMLNNRIGIDFTWYKKNAFDQILRVAVPPATGYQYELMNAGNVENKGVELALNVNVINHTNFSWDLILNYSKNKNKIIELNDQTNVQILSDGSISFLKVVAEVGGNYGDMLGYTYQRNESGKILVDDNGIPLKSEDMTKLGNYQPDWMMGLSNNFKIYGFDLAFMIDMRYGGKIYMGSMKSGAASGNLAMTLDGRESGFVVQDAVVKSTGEANTINVTSQDYWNGISAITEAWMYDATNVCFRELSLGYSLPKSISQKVKMSNIKISLVGRNLFMISSKTKGFNPEATYSTGNAQGIEYGTMPMLRSLGFNVNLNF
ncbi:MAG: SusC/RagA family TonB-linked outer membrane protein [Bacteroidota bacterium]